MKLTFKNLTKFASDNNFDLQENKNGSKLDKYTIKDLDKNDIYTCGNLRSVKGLIEQVTALRSDIKTVSVPVVFQNTEDKQLEQSNNNINENNTDNEPKDVAVSSIVDTSQTETVSHDRNKENKHKKVPGIGNIELLSIAFLQVGMYLYYRKTLYTVTNIERVNFANNKASYIVTVSDLVNASDSKKLLLKDDELLAAWMVSFEREGRAGSPRIPNRVVENSELKTQNSEPKEDKPQNVNKPAIELSKPTRAATHNRGIKGKGREMFIKLLASGATLEQIMTSFNWKEHTASNQLSYVKSWGYNWERQGKIYKLCS